MSLILPSYTSCRFTHTQISLTGLKPGLGYLNRNDDPHVSKSTDSGEWGWRVNRVLEWFS
jgi:hypothetical protein